MKKSFICALAASAMFLTGCNDFLDESMRDGFTNKPEFWNSANNVQTYLNTCLQNYRGYGWDDKQGWFYFKSLGDDQADPDFDNWYFTSVEGNTTYWSEPYEQIRHVNYAVSGLENSTLDVATDESNNSFLVPFIAPSDKTGEKTNTLRVSENNPTYNPSTQTFEVKNSSFNKSTINDLTIGERIKLPPIIETSTDISDSYEITGSAISYDLINISQGADINIGPQATWSIGPQATWSIVPK